MEIKDDVIRRVLERLPAEPKLEDVRQQFFIVLNDYDVVAKKTAIQKYSESKQDYALKMFFISKKIEGRSEKTLIYYKTVLRNLFRNIQKDIFDITSNDLKYYFAIRMQRDGLSKCSMDNERRALRSVFGWLEAEEYITKNPVLKIGAIKQEKRVKKAFTETELEKLRLATDTPRDRALIEFLYSTGARVSEASGCDRGDIKGDEVILYGKGRKERIGYLNERCVYYIKKYLAERTDDNGALFVSSKAPFKRLTSGTMEARIRKIGQKAGIANCHPHRFRRTCATMALNRGMPIDQVQKMLGHEDVKTTTIYAKSLNNDVKENHRRYIV